MTAGTMERTSTRISKGIAIFGNVLINHKNTIDVTNVIKMFIFSKNKQKEKSFVKHGL